MMRHSESNSGSVTVSLAQVCRAHVCSNITAVAGSVAELSEDVAVHPRKAVPCTFCKGIRI